MPQESETVFYVQSIKWTITLLYKRYYSPLTYEKLVTIHQETEITLLFHFAEQNYIETLAYRLLFRYGIILMIKSSSFSSFNVTTRQSTEYRNITYMVIGIYLLCMQE